MKFKRFRSDLATAQWGGRLWSGVALLMIVSNLVLAIYLLGHDSREKTIVVPPDMERPFSVRGNEASSEYLSQLGEWFASLTLSYTPKNIDYRSQVFLRYAAPESYSALQTHLQDEAKRIKRNEMSAMFFPMDARVRGEFVAITGEQVLRVGREIVSEKRITYRLQLRLQDGFPHIVEFIEVEREKPFSTADSAATSR